MISFIDKILPGRFVLVGIKDEGSRRLVGDAIAALEKIGYFLIYY